MAPIPLSRGPPLVDQSLNGHYAQSRDSQPAASSSHIRRPAPTETRAQVKNQVWPPSPAVEDEAVSLAKEQDPPALLVDSDLAHTPSRGSIDQLPIMLETETNGASEKHRTTETTAKQADASPETPRKRVVFAERDQVHQLGSSYSEKKEHESRPSGTAVQLDPINLSRRKPALYTYSPRQHDHAREDSKPAVTDATARPHQPPLPQDSGGAALDKTNPSNALRGEGKPREGRGRPDQSTPKPFSRGPSLPSQAPRVVNAQGPDHLSSFGSNLADNRRRRAHGLNISLQGSYSAMQSPVSTPPAQAYGGSDYLSAKRGEQICSATLHGALLNNLDKLPPSPPHSPRQSSGTPHSSPGSQQNSRSNSRQSSPIRNDSSRVHSRSTSATLAQDDRAQRRSKLAKTMAISDDTERPKAHSRPPKTASPSSLPYPADGQVVMPSEEQHISQLEELIGSPTLSPPGIRPPLLQRHSYDCSSSLLTRKSMPALKNGSGALPRTLGTCLTSKYRSPPSCPRAEPVRGHKDWYTLADMPMMNICPDCVQSTFADTPYKIFLQAAARGTSARIKCDFSSPWMRLAWRLTLIHQRDDLGLLVALARVQNTSQRCPGDKDSALEWQTVSDRKGRQIKHFDVCPADVLKIETLMPTISGVFEVNERSNLRRRQCDLHGKSPRNEVYMETLAEIHDEAWQKRTTPDVERFVDLVRRKTEIVECERDRVFEDGHFYYMRELAEFTVCEDCHHSIVGPARDRGAPIALRFLRVRQPVHDTNKRRESKRDEPVGASCQLWSPRMRRVFRRALEKNDFEYLAERARERKEVEDSYRTRKSAIKRELKREGGYDAHSAERIARLELDLDDEEAYWKKWQ